MEVRLAVGAGFLVMLLLLLIAARCVKLRAAL